MGALNVLVAVLAVRLILFVAVVGAFMLAWAVLKAPESIAWPPLVVLVGYAALVVCPLIWLSSRR